MCFVTDNVLYASMDVLDVDDCSMPCVCENASMNVYPHDCDAMLHKSLGVVDIPNIKLLKKEAKKFHKNLSKFHCKNGDLIAKLNESNKLVEKYKKFLENSLEILKEFECLNMDLDAKLVLSNKLVDELKCENESLKMHAKCLITKPIMVPDFVPIMCSTSKDKSVYIPPHKRNQKVERKALKPKPLSRSQSKVLDGSKFVPTCHNCGVFGHIRPQRPKLREQNHVARSLLKKPSGPKHIVCHHCGALGSFKLLKESKEKINLSFLEVVL